MRAARRVIAISFASAKRGKKTLLAAAQGRGAFLQQRKAMRISRWKVPSARRIKHSAPRTLGIVVRFELRIRTISSGLAADKTDCKRVARDSIVCVFSPPFFFSKFRHNEATIRKLDTRRRNVPPRFRFNKQPVPASRYLHSPISK